MDSKTLMRCSISSTSKVRRWASNNDVTACPSDGVIAPAPTASSTVPIALRESWEPPKAGRSSSMVPFPLDRQYAAQTEPPGRGIAPLGQVDTPPCDGFRFAIEQCFCIHLFDTQLSGFYHLAGPYFCNYLYHDSPPPPKRRQLPLEPLHRG